ncbi:MAG: HAMP domain-containing histidine kinase [Microcella sp.]|uniref:sensor histidine kinase n=1 Tax=Microcella sp. TaxID=1913979 RepID=UPI0024C81BE5|nr:HAMP domain-containing sensor histidine kinase [Microcella sp.]UYN82806.1 MAG: HAMP domain-containing histidine kinase [Microcella sp.]
MTAGDYGQVIATSAVVALAVGAIALVLLRLTRRAPLFVHVVVIVAAAVAAVGGGIAVTASAMYISDDDTRVALAVTATSGVVSLIMAAVLAMGLARDARGLGRDARMLGAGEQVTPRQRSTAELHAVQNELVDSSERLLAARDASERAEQARRDLVERIAHDLLAPLASIRAIAETLEDGMSAEPERHARQLGSHVTRLTALIGDLFALSRIDAGSLTITPERVSLSDLASDVVADYAPLAAHHEVTLRVVDGPGVTADVDPREFSRALTNVLINAIEHSPAGASVTVGVDTVGGDEERARVTVRDHGPGVDADDLPKLGVAGWRATSARSTPRVGIAGGAGLGLAITHAIVTAHGGEVVATNAEPGLAVSLLLPVRA